VNELQSFVRLHERGELQVNTQGRLFAIQNFDTPLTTRRLVSKLIAAADARMRQDADRVDAATPPESP
jgi:hypothetical protein